MLEESIRTIDFDTLRRQVRIILLLDGSERAGIAPIRVRRLHTYAYLSNVLAPVWKQRVFDGHLLKHRGGPFYPALQRDLDRLVGMGLVHISDVSHYLNEDGEWCVDGEFSLNYQLAGKALEIITSYPREMALRSFLLEVAYAVSALSDSEFDRLSKEDPTYSDPNVSFENVVDFEAPNIPNYSANSALHFSSLVAGATPAELLHLYVRHIRRRIGGNQ